MSLIAMSHLEVTLNSTIKREICLLVLFVLVRI